MIWEAPIQEHLLPLLDIIIYFFGKEYNLYRLWIIVASEASALIVASEASDLIFKIVIFYAVPPRSSSLYTGFSRTVWGGGGGRFCEADLTPSRWLGIS